MSDSSSQTFYMSSQKKIWVAASATLERRYYGNNELMSGIIAPTGASIIQLQLTYFNTERNYDFVVVKSCTAIDCLEFITLGRFSGLLTPFSVTSNSGVMKIEWSSDGSVTSSGWSATWSSGSIFLPSNTKILIL